MHTEKLRLVISSPFIHAALNSDTHALASMFNPQCLATGERITSQDHMRARALYNAVSTQAASCTFDQYAYVHYWIYRNQYSGWDETTMINNLIDNIINDHAAYLFLNEAYFFDTDRVAELYHQTLQALDNLSSSA